MKHFVKKHAPHFGLWALSGLILLGSTVWLNHVNQRSPAHASRTIVPTASIVQTTSTAPVPPAKEKSRAVPVPTQKNINPEPLAEPLIESLAEEKMVEENKISVSFKFIAPGWTKDLAVLVKEDSTVYEAMKELVKEGKISVEFKQFSGLGAFVQSIDGLAPKGNQYWIYYLNGQTANVGVSLTKLKNNDVITWRYETAKF